MDRVQQVLDDHKEMRSLVRIAYESTETDESGFISIYTLEAMMSTVANEVNCTPPTQAELEAILIKIGADKSNKISLDYLTQIIENVLQLFLEKQNK
jgi:hypothetical protein